MNPSGIITLTTDFGLADPYVAMIKGVILSINPSAKIIDLTHQIGVGSISQAAGLIRETFPFFPEATVHLAVVDPGVGSDRRLMALEARSHFFVGPDNGIFWPIFCDDEKARVVQLTETKFFLPHITQTFHGREVFAPVAAHLSLGVELERLGELILDPVRLLLPLPYQDDKTLYGQITRIDNFGNLITNIHSGVLHTFLGTAKPCFQVGKLVVKKLNRIYAESEEGEPLALINSSNLLEIAVNMGRASEYLGVDRGDTLGTEVRVSRS